MNRRMILWGGLLFSRLCIADDISTSIKIESRRVSIHCSPRTKDQENTFTYVYVDGLKELEMFHFRRPGDVEACRESSKEIRALLRANKKVEIFGFDRSRMVYERDVDFRGQKSPVLGNRTFFISTFDRIEGENGQCFGYFDSSCLAHIK